MIDRYAKSPPKRRCPYINTDILISMVISAIVNPGRNIKAHEHAIDNLVKARPTLGKAILLLYRFNKLDMSLKGSK